MSDDGLKISLADYGLVLGPRLLGDEIRLRVVKHVREHPNAKILFDLTGIKSISSGFAFDLFGKLKRDLGGSFFAVVSVKVSGAEEPENVKIIISRALAATSGSAEPGDSPAKEEKIAPKS